MATAPTKFTPENKVQKNENVTTLRKVLKENKVDPALAKKIVTQFAQKDR